MTLKGSARLCVCVCVCVRAPLRAPLRLCVRLCVCVCTRDASPVPNLVKLFCLFVWRGVA